MTERLCTACGGPINRGCSTSASGFTRCLVCRVTGRWAEEPPPRPKPILTAHQLDALRMVAEGLSDAEIAKQFCIDLLTCKYLIKRAYVRLGFSGRGARLQAVQWLRNINDR